MNSSLILMGIISPVVALIHLLLSFPCSMHYILDWMYPIYYYRFTYSCQFLPFMLFLGYKVTYRVHWIYLSMRLFMVHDNFLLCYISGGLVCHIFIRHYFFDGLSVNTISLADWSVTSCVKRHVFGGFGCRRVPIGWIGSCDLRFREGYVFFH